MMKEKPPKIVEKEGKTYIYDSLRKKYLVCTPEELVRQKVINYLTETLKYPLGLISVEAGLEYNGRMKRTDLVVYNKEGRPHILVECKSKQVGISKEAIFQIATYNHTLNAGILVVTDGEEMICLQVNRETGRLDSLSEIPPHKGISKNSE